MTDAEIMTMAIRMIKLERFRIKKLEDLKDGFYVRLFSNTDNSRAFLVRLRGKPMTNQNFNRKTVAQGTTTLTKIAINLHAIIDSWAVMGSYDIPERDSSLLPVDVISEDRIYIDDLMTGSNAYRLNSKVQKFAEDWNRLSIGDTCKVWDIYTKHTSRKATFNLDY